MLKSILGFENWTKKMSKIENRKHFPAFFFDVTRKSKNRKFILIFQMKISKQKARGSWIPYDKER